MTRTPVVAAGEERGPGRGRGHVSITSVSALSFISSLLIFLCFSVSTSLPDILSLSREIDVCQATN